MKQTSTRLLIITPAYHEEENIGAVIDEVKKISIPRVDITHLIIDDGSTDKTAEIARRAGVRVVSHPINLGVGTALQTGFKYAVRKGYDYALQIDADRQHKVEYAERVVKPVLQGECDICIGSRLLREEKGYKIPFTRRIGIKFYAKIISVLIGSKITDSTSGYRAMNKKVFSEFARRFPSTLWAVESEIWLGRRGYEIKEVPVKMREREKGKTHLDFWTMFYYPFKMIYAVLQAL